MKNSNDMHNTCNRRIPVKVLILPKFENGAMTGDAAGEAQYYYEHYCKDADAYDVFGGIAGNRLYVQNGVALYVTGCGKVNAVLGLNAVLHDDRFDFSEAYIFSVGCSGSAIGSTVMGDVFVLSAAIDFDLGHHADARDLQDGTQTTWFHNPIYDGSAYRIFSPVLTDRVFALVKDTKLHTTENTKIFMAKAFDNAAWALREPQVLRGTTLSGDNYWKGIHDHNNAILMANTYPVPDAFVCAEMEDAALAVALDRIGMLDRFIAVRVSVNMDVFTNGSTPENLWGKQAGAVFSADGDMESADIFDTAMQNHFRVGKRIIDAVLDGSL